MKRIFLFLICIAGFFNPLIAQTESFDISLEPFEINGLEGVQSYAFGQHEGKWLIIGGRTDGLHRRQPFASFSESGNQKKLIVIDPIHLQKWEAPLSSLSIALQDQLSSTNMQFHQEGNYLYLTGGYGYSQALRNHTTYDKLTAVDVSQTIQAIIQNNPFNTFFRQISDSNFAVTGGHLKKIKDTYYLVGGQNFMGRYNPMGPDHGPGFFQQYSDQIRKFTITDNGINIQISAFETITDVQAFHRRDYNLVPQILPNGKEGLTIFSGVFQQMANIPFLNSVTIGESSYTIEQGFAQYYNHYHSAVLPIYSLQKNEMHTIFFGGIAQYFDSSGVLVQNTDIPFVKTIARVSRNHKGELAEYKLPEEMPDFLGSGAEFIRLPSIPHYPNEVLKLDSIQPEKTLIGFIYGGISSDAANIFWVNTGKESKANNRLFKVYITQNTNSSKGILNTQSTNGLQLQVYPDFSESALSVHFYLSQNTTVNIQITDNTGNTLKNETFKDLALGEYVMPQKINTLKRGNTYWVTINAGSIQATQKIIIEP